MDERLKKILSKIKSNSLHLDSLTIDVSYSKNIAGWVGDMDPQDVCTMYHIAIKLMCYEAEDEDEDEVEVKIAEAICYEINPIDVLTGDEHYLFDVADSISGDAVCALSPYLDEEGTLKNEYSGKSILYIQLIKVTHEYRNKGIGSLILKYIIEHLVNHGHIITVIPSPLDYEDKKSMAFKDDFKKLVSFYESFEFQKKTDEVWSLNGM